MKRKTYIKIGLLMLSLLMLASCSSDKKTEGQIFNHFEKAAKLEDGFNKQQQPLVDAENKEQKLYNQIIKLDMSDYSKIKKLSNEALDSIANRKGRLQKEKASMKAAHQEFLKAKPYLNELKNTDAKKAGQQAYETMQKRYEQFKKMADTYSQSMDDDQKLYQMLSNKKITVEKLQKQIDIVNKNYKTINKEEDQFNNYTDQFNSQKKAFYKATGMNIK